MITYSNDKTEVFDSVGAKMFSELVDRCNGNKKLAYRILWDCRAEMSDGSFLSFPELIYLGEFLYEQDKTWTPAKAKLVQLISKKEPKLHKSYRQKLQGNL